MKRISMLFLMVVVIVPFSAFSEGQTFQVLHSFKGGPSDGSYPSTPLLLTPQGAIIGATSGGGADVMECNAIGCGTLFELTKGYGHWKQSILYNFSSTSGNFPAPTGPLTMDVAGNIYGTQETDGDLSCNCGAVYQLAFGNGVWTQNVLHNFLGGTTDGALPSSGLVQDAAGNFYGTTESGGVSGSQGTVFQLKNNSDGTFDYSVIYRFGAVLYDGEEPFGPLTIDSLGNLYGTTVGGGNYGFGTVFRLAPSGDTWMESILFNFTLDYGSSPFPVGVVFDAAGNLYGTTQYGGAYAVGTIYKLTPSVGYWNRTILRTFTGGSDGAVPTGSLSIDSSGTLYGACNAGGTFGHGNVYKITRANGKWRETPLHQFKGTDGSSPYPGVVLDAQGNIYGVTGIDGIYGYGVAFEITP